ncbi:DNA-processing protein DprA [Pseudokineococcus basanitobsidens]|uniref:DNA-processing protein DprA n=1 Tax=Pseudokineococcus basanitobsidens TaxID=1926649 RepID=A0ABU8RK68_9ACTN
MSAPRPPLGGLPPDGLPLDGLPLDGLPSGGQDLPAWAGEDRWARAAWSRLAEPGDAVAAALRTALGPVGALALVLAGGADDAVPALERATASPRARAALRTGLERWRTRLPGLDPRRDADVVARLGGRVVVPGDDEWPRRLGDLGDACPPCLWVRGAGRLGPLVERSAALVGSRAASAYGEHVAGELAAGLAEQHVTVVSGGAFGIDAAAHRAALAVGGATVAVLACGVDRAYPVAHEPLLARIAAEHVVVSEQPPGSAPTRWRFLERNRLVAAGSGAVVVVEAAWRSGALSTATRAAALLRPLGAVPGPVTSSTSAGCHRIMRELQATCVTEAADVVELVDAADGAARPRGGPADPPRHRPLEGLEGDDLRVADALPVRRGAPAASVARAAGLTEREVVAALGRLSLSGHADQVGADERGSLWRRGDPSR